MTGEGTRHDPGCANEHRANEPSDSVAELIKDGALAAAAEICATAGDHARAAELFEQACEFQRAAQQSLAAKQPDRAMYLAVLAGDDVLSKQIQQLLLETGPEQLVEKVAEELAARGHHLPSGQLYLGLGEHLPAAEALERAGQVCQAAKCYEKAGNPAQAARTLETALRTQHLSLSVTNNADELRAELGCLYTRHQRHEAAVRVLQQLPTDSPHRPRTLTALARSLKNLGLHQALQDLRAELQRHDLPSTDQLDQVTPQPTDLGPAETKLYGRYEVVREVATTPHARLLEAVDAVTELPVAVKILASRLRGAGRDALQRFAREAQALAKLRHPNVVPLREYLPEGPAMVLQWMAGGSLYDLLQRGAISPARAAEITRAVLAALAEAHRLGILHRDVKPSNLLFDEAGTAMLADFGAAHLSESEATVTAGEIGTVAYMSPEQRLGRAATVQSDVYSAGVLFYEMLTGRLPELAEGAPVPSAFHPDLTTSHDRVLQRLLAELPTNRFDNARVASDAIAALEWSPRLVDRLAAAPRATTQPVITDELCKRLIPSDDPSEPSEAGLKQHDSWLGRDITLVPCDESHLRQAAAFARAGHPALPTVLRVDQEANHIWLEPACGTALAASITALNESEYQRLSEALAALHRVGGAHGCIDAQHVYRYCDTVYLAYPKQTSATANAELDQQALEQLR